MRSRVRTALQQLSQACLCSVSMSAWVPSTQWAQDMQVRSAGLALECKHSLQDDTFYPGGLTRYFGFRHFIWAVFGIRRASYHLQYLFCFLNTVSMLVILTVVRTCFKSLHRLLLCSTFLMAAATNQLWICGSCESWNPAADFYFFISG